MPPSAPIRRRPIIVRIALAAAFLGGMALAFAAGVLITVKKNGQTYQVEVPAESHTVVEPSGKVTVDLGGKPEAGQAAVDPAAELKALRGVWNVVRTQAGKNADLWSWLNACVPASIERLRFQREDVEPNDTLTFTDFRHGSIAALTYRIDPTTTPKTIDLLAGPHGTTQELAAVGIYELQGDVLRMCLTKYHPALKGVPRRPTRFAVEPDSSDVLFVFARYHVSEDEKAIEQSPWAVISEVDDGKALPQKEAQGREVAFWHDGFQMNSRSQKFLLMGLFRLDPMTQPKKITLFINSARPPWSTEAWSGIYQLDKDRLQIAYHKAASPPAKFESLHGWGIRLLTLEKKKSEEPPFSEPGPAAPAQPAAGRPGAKQTPAVNPAAEIKALQGEWKVVQLEKGNAVDSWRLPGHAGLSEPVDLESIARVSISEAALMLYDFKHATYSICAYRIDPTASPKPFDLLRRPSSRATGAAPEETLAQGICEIQGDRLKLCLAKYLSSVTSQQRPERFTIEPSSGDVLLVLERHRPSAEEQAVQDQWWIAQQIDDGKVVPEDALNPRQFSLGQNIFRTVNVVLTDDGRRSLTTTVRGLYLLDPAKQPQRITLLREPIKARGLMEKPPPAEALVGIFRLEGDRLEIAYRKGDSPPQQFESPPGSGVTLLKLQKNKPEAPKPEPPKPAEATPYLSPAAELKALQDQWKVVRVEKGKAAEAFWPLDAPPGKTTETVARLNLSPYWQIVDFKHPSHAGELFTYTIDPTAGRATGGRKTIDVRKRVLSKNAREPDSLEALGLYELRGDHLKICLAHYVPSLQSEQRPRSFVVRPDSADVLLTLERFRPTEDDTAIKGAWTLGKQLEDGKSIADAELRDRNLFRFMSSRFGVGGQMVRNRVEKYAISGYFELDPAKQPKSMTLYTSQYDEDLLGIYQFEGDRLTIACRKGGPRPEKFESPPGSGITLFTLQRKKPEEAKPEAGEPSAAEAPTRKPEGGQPAAVNPAAELMALQGKWKVVRVDKGKATLASFHKMMQWGSELEPADVDRFEFGDNLDGPFLRMRLGKNWDFHWDNSHTFRIDPTARPKAIDLLGRPQNLPVETRELLGLGIYEIEGDRLKICLAPYLPSVMSEQRPKRFEIGSDSGDTLFVLERYPLSEDEQIHRAPAKSPERHPSGESAEPTEAAAPEAQES